jgi:hypothetical protein
VLQALLCADAAGDCALPDAQQAASLDEGLLSLSLSNLLYMENPYSYKRFHWRITARPRISTQAGQRGAVLTAVGVALNTLYGQFAACAK